MFSSIHLAQLHVDTSDFMLTNLPTDQDLENDYASLSLSIRLGSKSDSLSDISSEEESEMPRREMTSVPLVIPRDSNQLNEWFRDTNMFTNIIDTSIQTLTNGSTMICFSAEIRNNYAFEPLSGHLYNHLKGNQGPLCHLIFCETSQDPNHHVHFSIVATHQKI